MSKNTADDQLINVAADYCDSRIQQDRSEQHDVHEVPLLGVRRHIWSPTRPLPTRLRPHSPIALARPSSVLSFIPQLRNTAKRSVVRRRDNFTEAWAWRVGGLPRAAAPGVQGPCNLRRNDQHQPHQDCWVSVRPSICEAGRQEIHSIRRRNPLMLTSDRISARGTQDVLNCRVIRWFLSCAGKKHQPDQSGTPHCVIESA